MPSRSAVPGATISSALISPGSGRSFVVETLRPDRGATTPHSTAFSRRFIAEAARTEPEIGPLECAGPPVGCGMRPLRRLRERPRGGPRGSAIASAWRSVAASQAPSPLPAGAITASQTVLGGLGQPPLGVADPAQLAGQAELTEAGSRRVRCSGTPRAALATASATARSTPGSSTRTPPTTLTNTSRAAGADPAVARKDREHEREPVAIEARDDAARLLELRGGHQRLHLDQQRARALHRRQHDAAGRARGLAPRTAPRRRAPRPGRPGASRTGRPRWSSRSGSSAPAARGRGARARPRTAARSRPGARARAGPQARPPWSRARRGSPRSPRAFAELHDPRGDLAHLADRCRARR